METKYATVVIMDVLNSIAQIIILIISVVIHEVSHGYMADYLGDVTARYAGRLTLNPLKHLDWLGSVIVPGALILLGSSYVIGWAKPVPFNPLNLRNRRWGGALVAIAGPLSNLVLALIFGMVVRYSIPLGITNPLFLSLCSYVVLINLVLMVFNLVPLPPLDGHHILFAILWKKYAYITDFLARNSMWIFIIFFFFLWKFVSPLVEVFYRLIVGV